MDNVFIDAIRESIGKAVAAAESGSPSGGTVRENAYYPLTGMVVASGVPDIRSRGDLPVIRGGKLEGAIGASGAQTDEQDEECARGRSRSPNRRRVGSWCYSECWHLVRGARRGRLAMLMRINVSTSPRVHDSPPGRSSP
jgi:Haem degrading protein HbpS-like